MSNRKEEIVRAAVELSAENGVDAVSMQMIADKVGITKASLYNHFSSKDEIIEAMYEVIRASSKERTGVGEIDYDLFQEGMSMEDILMNAIRSYEAMVSDPEMNLFYRIIMSRRTMDPKAAGIMAKETKTMVNATKTLFYALQVKKIASFKDVDVAAFSFAMGVHSIIDYGFDLKSAGEKTDAKMMQTYIKEFCRIYG